MPQTLTDHDLCRAAKTLGVGTAEILAVDETESRGAGFDRKGRPKILFERHIFYKYCSNRKIEDPDTGKAVTLKSYLIRTHPNLCNRKPGGYGKSSQQYQRFSTAFSFDPVAAMMSCSWGRYQIMGFNFAICGFTSVHEFVDAMKESEGRQLDAFVQFVIGNHLDDELRRHDWAGFARGYNGPAYRKNKYDTKLATAFAKHSKKAIDCDSLPDPPDVLSEEANVGGGPSVPLPIDPPIVPPTTTTEPRPPLVHHVEDWKPFCKRWGLKVWGAFSGVNASAGIGTLTMAMQSPEYSKFFAYGFVALVVITLVLALLLSVGLFFLFYRNRQELQEAFYGWAVNSADPERADYVVEVEKK